MVDSTTYIIVTIPWDSRLFQVSVASDVCRGVCSIKFTDADGGPGLWRSVL